MSTSTRCAFTQRVHPDQVAAYRERHATVWPELLVALRDAGWRNYSLFLSEDGLLVGYLETDNFAASLAAMQGQDVNTRWQREMAEFFMLPGGASPDLSLVVLDEVFHLEDQLAASPASRSLMEESR